MFVPPSRFQNTVWRLRQAAAPSDPGAVASPDSPLQPNLCGLPSRAPSPGRRGHTHRRVRPGGAESARSAPRPGGPRAGRERWKIPPGGCGDAPRRRRPRSPSAPRAHPRAATARPCGLCRLAGRPIGRGGGQSGAGGAEVRPSGRAACDPGPASPPRASWWGWAGGGGAAQRRRKPERGDKRLHGDMQQSLPCSCTSCGAHHAPVTRR